LCLPLNREPASFITASCAGLARDPLGAGDPHAHIFAAKAPVRSH